MDMVISKGAEYILSTLEEAGFEAYVVGGAVRDFLMGKVPSDYDIATNATPREVKSLFSRTIDTGIKHGTVTVIENKTGFEVTTYRTEAGYRDMRHPDSVEYVDELKEDLKRRDFTINAMAYAPRSGWLMNFAERRTLKKRL